MDVSNATLELYPNRRTRAFGSRWGKKSLSQSFSPAVQVASAWKTVFVGFNPWTATKLFDSRQFGTTMHTILVRKDILNGGLLGVNNSPEKVLRHACCRLVLSLHCTRRCAFCREYVAFTMWVESGQGLYFR